MTDEQLGFREGRLGLENRFPLNANYAHGFTLGESRRRIELNEDLPNEMTDKTLPDNWHQENKALRSFLMYYGATAGITVGGMRRQMTLSGHEGCWPAWADSDSDDHLTKGAAQEWVKFLLLYTDNEEPVIEVSIQHGITHLPNGETVDLLEIQAALNSAFGETGEQRYATAANELAKLTGKVQGPHEEWLDREEN